MSSFNPDRNRLDRLRAGYREAFREWISARKFLGVGRQSAAAESQAQAHEVAAALAYRTARNHLTDAMSSGWGGSRGYDGIDTGRRPSLPIPESSLSRVKKIERREWLRDFVLVLALIVLAVAGGTFLSLVVSPAK